MIDKKVSYIAFIAGIFLYIINLRFNFSSIIHQIIFWLSIILLVSTICIQIFHFESSSRTILFELIVLYLLLHLIYQVGYFGLRGSDSYFDYKFLKVLLEENYFSLGQITNNGPTEQWIKGWPMLHVLTSILVNVTKINSLFIAKYMPSLISSFIALPIYLLGRAVYSNEKTALFSVLIYGTIPQFMMFNGLFVRETYALFIMALLMYIIYISKKYSDNRFNLLSIVIIPALVLGHHFTSFMFLILISLFLISYYICSYLDKDQLLNTNMNKIKVIITLFFTSLLTYWMFHTAFILNNFKLIYLEVTGYQAIMAYSEQLSLNGPIVTLKGYIIYYGFYFFNVIFGTALIYNVVLQRRRICIEDLSYTAYFFFCNLYGFLSLFILGSLLFPQRFLSFGWIAGIFPLVAFIEKIKKTTFKRLYLVLLISFIFYNIYNIDSSYITADYSTIDPIADYKDYVVAKTIQIPIEKNTSIPQIRYFGDTGVRGVIYELQGLDQIEIGKSLFSINSNSMCNSSEIAIINEKKILNNIEQVRRKSNTTYGEIMQIISYKNGYNINKIAQISDDYYVLKGGCE